MPDERIIPEMSHPTSVCPSPERWSAYDNMATEIEVLDFLRSLVVMLKPRRVIETGCYHGHATERMLQGLLQNDEGGIIYSCDLDASAIAATRARLSLYTSSGAVILYQCSGLDLIKTVPDGIDFAFLDSGPDEVRCHELRALYPHLAPGAVVAIHDSGIQGYLREKYLPPLLRELAMQFIFFDTPRGLALCRKRPVIYP